MDKETLQQLVSDVLNLTSRITATRALFNAVLAIGSLHLNLGDGSRIVKTPKYNASVFFRESLKIKRQAIDIEASIQNLQVCEELARK